MELDVMISYNRLWKLLIDEGMSRAELIKATAISPNTMTKMVKGEEVSMRVLVKICKVLSCSFGDICEYIDTEGNK